MLRVGLTGGIGAGKSTVARRLAALGALIVDADVIAREVVAPGTEGLAAVVDAFGPEVVAADGSLDRAAVAARVFGDREALARLNAIVHPLVGTRTAELLAGAPPDGIVVQDVPLLVENRLGRLFPLVVVVDAPVEERVRRLVGSRGLAEADARARIAAQASEPDRRAAADVWLDNSGPPGEVEAAVDRLWEERLVPFEADLRTGTYRPRRRYQLAGPDPAWPAAAQRLAARVAAAAGDTAAGVEHVGSTAVPGLASRDVIDLQLAVSDGDAADKLPGALGALGFVPLVDDGRADLAFASADPGRGAHVHVRPVGSPGWRAALLVRDWLRAHPDERAAYESHKRALEAAAGSTPGRPADADAKDADAKDAWFTSALARAEAWAVRTGWSPPASPLP